MAGVVIDQAEKAFGATAVLKGVSLEVADGEFCVIVGASGCGKSTLLRAIAGLDQLDSGSISIGDSRIDRLPPADRGIAMVFQSYALYPHLSVYENMAFALRLAKRPKDEVDAAVRRASQILGLDDYLERKPAALSGGQRQRVAIGRAIVRQPDVFLFDEPLSNLDASLRNRMRFEFAELHKTLAHHDHLRHPRPGRGDDAGRPHRRDARGPGRAGRHPDRALRSPRQPLRRRVPRARRR